jgi:hypothetical protein
MANGYLIDAPEKEHEAIRRLPYLIDGLKERFEEIGLLPYFSWYMLEIDMTKLCDSMKGDVDILAGRLSWNDPQKYESLVLEHGRSMPNAHPSWHKQLAAEELAAAGGIKWPPDTDYLIGIEAKCCHLPRRSVLEKEILEQHVRSKKSNTKQIKKIQKQVVKLLDMGFNKTVLLDWVINPPAQSASGSPFLDALSIAWCSLEAIEPILAERLPADSTLGHWAHSIGAVQGGDETERGSGLAISLRTAQENVLVQNSPVHQQRQEMERSLKTILEGLPHPIVRDGAFLSVFYIHCRNCHRIHELRDICKGKKNW